MPTKINLSSTSFKKINRSLKYACLVLRSSFGAIGAELKCGGHPHQVLVTSSSKQAGGNASTQSRGLQHNKNSEQVRGNASTQPRGLCNDKESEQAGGNASTQLNSKETCNAFGTLVHEHQCLNKMQPIFQLIDVSVPNKIDSCSAFQMVAHGHNSIIESTSFKDSSFQLVVKFILISNSEGAQFTLAILQTFKLIDAYDHQKLIVMYANTNS
jgi:hypothetical protein